MKTAGDFAESLTRYWEFCLAFRSEVCAAIADRDAEHEAEKNALRAEVEAARAPLPLLIHCPLCQTKHVDEGEFAAKVHHTHACQGCGHVWRPAVVPTVGVEFLPGYKNEYAPPADSPVPAVTITLSKGPDAGTHPWPQTALPSFRTVAGADLFLSNSVWVAFDRFEAKILAPVLARLDALEARIELALDAITSCRSSLSNAEDDLGTKVTALERVVKRIDTEHAEMCPQHMGLAAPPAPVSEPPMCYQIDCRYYGQRHATTHEPREPEAAGLVHAFVPMTNRSEAGGMCRSCRGPRSNPIHATERK